RSDARVVEARGDGVRLADLPVVVLQHERARAVQHALTAASDRRRVLLRRDAEAAGLDAAQLHARVTEERGERPDCVRPAADACDDEVWQRSDALEVLRARLAPDDRLQLANDRGVRMGAERRTE